MCNITININKTYHYRILICLGCYLSSLSLIEDRLGGVWNRFTVCGVEPYHFLISHFISSSCLMLLQTTEFFAFLMFLAFNINLRLIILVWIMLVMTGLTGVLFGLALSVLTDDTKVVSGASFFLTFPLMTISGKLNSKCDRKINLCLSP